MCIIVANRKSHSAVTKELDLKRTQLLWESNKLSEAEAKLHQSQQEQAKFKKEQTKLRMKIHEVIEELEQGMHDIDIIFFETLKFILTCTLVNYLINVHRKDC